MLVRQADARKLIGIRCLKAFQERDLPPATSSAGRRPRAAQEVPQVLVGDAHVNVRVRGCAATAGRPLRTTSCHGDVLHRLQPAQPRHMSSSVIGRITWLSSPAGPWNISIE
jgi:hypothetical protein